MTSIESVILEVPDPSTAEAFYAAAFGLGDRLGVARLGRSDDAASEASRCRSWCRSRAPSTA